MLSSVKSFIKIVEAMSNFFYFRFQRGPDAHCNIAYHCLFFSYNENRRVMDFGYPKYISEDFAGINTTINAAIYKDGEPE